MLVVSIDNFWFSIITVLYVWWYIVIYRQKDTKSIYFIYYFFNFCVFYGPLFYYYLGFTAYSNALSERSISIFYYINVVNSLLNILFYTYNKKIQGTIFFRQLATLSFQNLQNRRLINQFYFFALLISFIYIVSFRNYFPLMMLLQGGELGERLDTSGAIPLYITFSSIFMVFVPTAFFYFKYELNNRFINIILFFFTIFCLSAGGNKGIVSFFLIFYVLFNTQGNIVRYLILFIVLMFVYGVLKGITEINDETISYMIESPFRRVFAAQGAGYIARIELLLNNLFIDGYSIKHQVYSFIYNGALGSGSSPTHFTGDLIVQIGFFLTFIIYFFYVVFFTKLMNTLSFVMRNREDSFILWSFFVLVYITTNSELTIANSIRTVFVVANIVILKIASRVK